MTGSNVHVTVKVIADLPMAWRHNCGTLNDGPWSDQVVCSGCSQTAEPGSVIARYLLALLPGERE